MAAHVDQPPAPEGRPFVAHDDLSFANSRFDVPRATSSVCSTTTITPTTTRTSHGRLLHLLRGRASH